MSTEAPVVPEVKAPTAPEATPPAVTPPADPPKPDRVFTQSELDEIVEKRLAKERRKREEIKREADVFRKLALDRGNDPAQKREPQPSEDREPVRGDFETYEDFIAARADHRATKTAQNVVKKDREETAQKQRDEDSRKAGESFRSKVKDNAKGIEDFDEVMSEATSRPQSAVSRLPADPIANSDNPAKILYHLATHPEEAERIASLPLGQQAREIWKLDANLSSAKPPAKPSKAPAPIDPVGGAKTTPVGEMPDPATQQKEWLAWRNDQVRLKRTGKAA